MFLGSRLFYEFSDFKRGAYLGGSPNFFFLKLGLLLKKTTIKRVSRIVLHASRYLEKELAHVNF